MAAFSNAYCNLVGLTPKRPPRLCWSSLRAFSGAAVVEYDAPLDPPESIIRFKRTRLSRTMSRQARQEFSVNLQCGWPVRRALLDTGQRQADLPYGVKVNCAPVFLRGIDLLRRRIVGNARSDG